MREKSAQIAFGRTDAIDIGKGMIANTTAMPNRPMSGSPRRQPWSSAKSVALTFRLAWINLAL